MALPWSCADGFFDLWAASAMLIHRIIMADRATSKWLRRIFQGCILEVPFTDNNISFTLTLTEMISFQKTILKMILTSLAGSNGFQYIPSYKNIGNKQ